MIALLGPDLGDGQRRGTLTNANSLQPVMGLLNANSVKSWKAGHMLNAEFGGNGNSDANLTPLTTAANNAHRVFEGHIKRMLLLCNQLDRADANVNEWYCVLYAVTVSPTTYANAPATNDMHSYAYSHISLQYGFVKLPKFPPLGAPPHAMPGSAERSRPRCPRRPEVAQLTGVVRRNFAPSVNIVNWLVVANMNGVYGIGFSVEVHNEPHGTRGCPGIGMTVTAYAPPHGHRHSKPSTSCQALFSEPVSPVEGALIVRRETGVPLDAFERAASGGLRPLRGHRPGLQRLKLVRKPKFRQFLAGLRSQPRMPVNKPGWRAMGPQFGECAKMTIKRFVTIAFLFLGAASPVLADDQKPANDAGTLSAAVKPHDGGDTTQSFQVMVCRRSAKLAAGKLRIGANPDEYRSSKTCLLK